MYTDRKENKGCFVFDSNQVGELFSIELEKRLGVIVHRRHSWRGFELLVDITAYCRALEVGTKMFLSNQEYKENGDWLDYYNVRQKSNMGLVLYGILLRNRVVTGEWIYELPEDIEKFQEKLIDFFGKRVYVEADFNKNALLISIEGMLEQKRNKKEMKKFLKENRTPFEKIKYFSFIGKIFE